MPDSPRSKRETTATMLTMGAAVEDDEVLPHRPRPASTSSSAVEITAQRPWWKRGLDTLRQVASQEEGESSAVDDTNNSDRPGQETTHYRPLEEGDNHRNAPFRAGRRTSPRRNEGGVMDVLASSGIVSAAASRASTREDALQEDCSFFYMAQNDNHQKSTRGRFRAVRYEEHQHTFSYQDAVDVLTPSFLQAYRSRYQQLNQVVDPTPLCTDDLALSEGQDDVGQFQKIVKAETTNQSSIFFEHHDGRVLMRLPMDAVRLVMDPDLEAGVLSVEQWRRPDPATENGPWEALSNHTDLDNQPLHERPPLRYVLTVPPDLYRRVVAEMSDNLSNPYWGMTKCFSDNDKADIRIAIFILVVVFFILLINTEALGPHS